MATASSGAQPIELQSHPSRYRHWKLDIEGAVARLALDVVEEGGLRPDYRLKLNSYDLSVDIELADAVDRIRFQHPAVRVVLIESAKERVFCSGANIYMLGSSHHAFKVNFCKFTNETRLAIEDASASSGIRFLCAVDGPCAGGGYELALACDEIHLVDDGSSTVSLPEVPLLGVLPGTGGLTRVVDKRMVRRDRADVFSTLAEGVRGKRALEWGLVDAIHPRSRFAEALAGRAKELAEAAPCGEAGQGIELATLAPREEGIRRIHPLLTLSIDRELRCAEITIEGPSGEQPADRAAIVAAGSDYWPLAAFRQLDETILHLRFNEPEIGTLVLRTTGEIDAVLAIDATLHELRNARPVAEILGLIKRTLKRLELSARSLIALIEPGSCFAGTLFELALAADRCYMLDDPERPVRLALSKLNGGAYPMSNGWSRLRTRFLADPAHAEELGVGEGRFDPQEAESAGLVSFIPDDIDWEDEIRLAVEERSSLSPDALTGMEANLRFAGPETLETKIFGRLSAWQNWIFQRPNAVGERGALAVYGQAGLRPEFDWWRT